MGVKVKRIVFVRWNSKTSSRLGRFQFCTVRLFFEISAQFACGFAELLFFFFNVGGGSPDQRQIKNFSIIFISRQSRFLSGKNKPGRFETLRLKPLPFVFNLSFLNFVKKKQSLHFSKILPYFPLPLPQIPQKYSRRRRCKKKQKKTKRVKINLNRFLLLAFDCGI